MEELSSNVEEQKDVIACPSKIKKFGLSKDDKVRKSSDYQRIMQKGSKYRASQFNVRTLRNQSGRTRLGIAVSKKAGNACVRNLIKRRLREYFRLNRDKLPPDMDIVFIAQKAASTLNTKQLQEELDRFFGKYFQVSVK